MISDGLNLLKIGKKNALGSATGKLKASKFFVGEAPHDADDCIIYNKSTGGLIYDADGTGPVSSVLIATMGTSVHLH